MRRTLSVLAATALAAATAVVTAGSAAAKTPPANGQAITTSPYVTLGDSYSSAAGVNPLDPTAPVTCSRSLRNYAHDIATQTKPSSFTDVTCSGAKTSDFFSSQATGSPHSSTRSPRTPAW